MASSLEDRSAEYQERGCGRRVRAGRLTCGLQSERWSSNELAQTTAEFTAAVTQVFNLLAESFTRLNDQFNFAPQQGWPYSGGNWSLAVGGNRSVATAA